MNSRCLMGCGYARGIINIDITINAEKKKIIGVQDG